MIGQNTSASSSGLQPQHALSASSSEHVKSRNNSTSSLKGPGSKPKQAHKTKKSKSKNPLKGAKGESVTPKLVFSVDDDVNETIGRNDGLDSTSQRDLDYIEGYNDALKALYRRSSKAALPKKTQTTSYINEEDRENSSSIVDALPDKSQNSEVDGVNNVFPGEDSVKPPKSTEDNKDRKVTHEENSSEGEEEEEGPGNDDESVKSSSSSQTIESLNLRERQNAINSTHPFGIKIWKPSLYKKNRSVATRADEDIHDYVPDMSSYKISWGVRLCNILWSCTFGLILYCMCLMGALTVFFFSGFALHHHSRPYVKLLFRLGKYWLYPFGKFVLLNKDDNYLDEDQLEGRTVSEYQKWRSQEEGRLFFAPPRRYTNANESRPLIKDHKGRPLRDIYGSIDDAHPLDQNVDHDFEDGDDDPNQDIEVGDIKRRFFGRGGWSSGRILFYLYFYIILQPFIAVIAALCWLIVFTIPMFNLSSILCDHLRRHPLALRFELEERFYDGRTVENIKKKYKNSSIILCTYRSCGFHYYKYTFDGTNIFFINLLASVIFVIFDYYILKEQLKWDTWFTNSSFLFSACLFSVIPLAYFIGQAVASVSAQSSMGVAAVINAFFSSVVEIFLYCVALSQSKSKLVEGSMIGSILGAVLLLPGLSMCGGALKRKTQRYNPHSAGVSSTMLLFAVVTMFAPSLFYQIYGSYEIKCKKSEDGHQPEKQFDKCRFIQPTFSLDELYYSIIKPFSLLVALALFSAYVCGLFFTLRTHASLIWVTTSHETGGKREGMDRSTSISSIEGPKAKIANAQSNSILPIDSSRDNDDRVTSTRLNVNNLGQPIGPRCSKTKSNREMEDDSTLRSTAASKPNPTATNSSGHDAPNWSRQKSVVILLAATLLYSVIAEILVDNVDEVLKNHPIDPKFLGLTVFALIPNTTEFMNAISFAVGGNVALSMEIGSAYALQVVLIQIPSLVLFSIYNNFDTAMKMFSLVFPRWDIIATLISIYLFTYVYAEGKSNYFKGVILILIYIVVLSGFWFNDKIEQLDDDYVSSSVFSALYHQ
ncbi:Piso0_005762 [Millerozyma farinosa CBS 7064]|uniref:Piso0_005762 protein n=1 Tax=Pichia sorbitophila (strain ATCC MYA-4447 / BCRC 22081 / CBS 7064 / NBRC 10061 / NRRL Y-12695) TaxID=559304 RepID=G8XZW0_PICSO|nr:Piso0_005762 [Millerozyma farinosa CBS 7064]